MTWLLCPESSTSIAPAPRSPVVIKPVLTDATVYGGGGPCFFGAPLLQPAITAQASMIARHVLVIASPSSVRPKPHQHRRFVELACPHVQLQQPLPGVRNRYRARHVVSRLRGRHLDLLGRAPGASGGELRANVGDADQAAVSGYQINVSDVEPLLR